MKRSVFQSLTTLKKLTEDVPAYELMGDSFAKKIAIELGEPPQKIVELQIHIASAALTKNWSKVTETVIDIVNNQRAAVIREISDLHDMNGVMFLNGISL